jgi:CheY-like chemotaxis protein
MTPAASREGRGTGSRKKLGAGPAEKRFWNAGTPNPNYVKGLNRRRVSLVCSHKAGYNCGVMNIAVGPILVVEDVPNMLELLEVPVITAWNGQEALEQVQKEHPALVITDNLMPKMDGYTLAHRLRSKAVTRNNPLIFLSATYVTPEDKQFAASLGAVRFIEKPIDTEEFLLTEDELLAQDQESAPEPLGEHEFYSGYRERLEHKLRHNNTQIARTERLLTSLPESQRPAFEALLKQSQADRDDIQAELNQIRQILDDFKHN